MNIEKLIGSISIVIIIIVTIIAFISGTFWINAMHVGDSKQGMWLFITINCVVILLIIMGINQILSYRQKREKYKAIEYVNKKKANIATAILIIGGLLTVVPAIILIYLLALIPNKNSQWFVLITFTLFCLSMIGIALIIIALLLSSWAATLKKEKLDN